MCNTDDVIKCRKCATQMKSSYGREARNDQSNCHIDSHGLIEGYGVHPLPSDYRVVHFKIQFSLNRTLFTYHPENDSIFYNKFGKKDQRVILIILDNSLNILKNTT